MIKKETYINCNNENVYEGMTSISAIIKKCEERENCQKINKVIVDSKKIHSKSREIEFLRCKSQKLGFEIVASNSEEIDSLTTGNTHGGIIAICTPSSIPCLEQSSDLIIENGIYIMLDGI